MTDSIPSDFTTITVVGAFVTAEAETRPSQVVDTGFAVLSKKEEHRGGKFWDRLPALSTFFSTCVLGAIGLLFTQSYNVAQVKMQEIQNEANREVQKARQAADERFQEAQLRNSETELRQSEL